MKAESREGTMVQENQELIAGWKQRVNDQQKESYTLSIKHMRTHFWTGIPTIVFAAIAGATLLLDVQEPGMKTTAGVLGVLAAGLCALLTFYSQSQRAEQHRCLSSQMVHIRRDIEMFERFVPTRKKELEERIRQINENLSAVEGGGRSTELDTRPKSSSWFLPVLAGAILLGIVAVIGNEWVRQIPATQQTVAYGVRESVQHGLETWEFDVMDPLLEDRIILVNTLINEITTQKTVTLLKYLNGQDPEAPITLYLSSSGGYIKDAYAIVNAIQESEAPVNAIAIGDCFSACAKILMGSSGVRKIAPDSRVMIHTHAYPYDDDPRSADRILYDRERSFIQKYSKLPLDWVDRKEHFYYLTPEQAVSYGLVDMIQR
jgi:ATP-dependent Clp endopeptidase proteolytic subunit ClpP